MAAGRLFRAACAAALAVALTGCDTSQLAPRNTATTPQTRPAGLVPPKPAAATPAPQQASQASRDLARYYARLQSDLLARGLLRTDGGGPDTLYTDEMLLRNFQRIALADEYRRGSGLSPAGRDDDSAIKKWTKPIRVSAEFGAAVPAEQAASDRRQLSAFVSRLSRITGHPIAMSDADPNFYVLFMTEDDRASVVPRIRQIVPDVNPVALRVFETLPRSIHCLVIAFSDTPGGYDYGTAIALIRSEHPDLLRLSCIHEEVAQGLGLGNDDPSARPSIFNDDDEFALLTSHDELLLRILYDPRLRPGMTAEEAMPIARQKVAELMGGPS
ncbi:DUF2927 domain-containing protein [Thalassococcus sp. CAU 1522]|uniref:DUF2927 domain-containing protein n=1 Tax=Thalassococcus arenae TaxID=2851652 RepID=A0ABS6N7C5_9RHOB|nr:DUF2927 domain-containing protein [Thalassococcus arenae]MBV2359916.1 DUF2927 domain-containing protein [Thalassococcus arenae]